MLARPQCHPRHVPSFGNDPSSTPGSPVAAATPGPGTEQCHSARQDVTLAAESCKARLLRQESGAKPLPHPSRALGHRQPHISHPTARPRGPTSKWKEIGSPQEPVPQAGNKRITGDPPAGDASQEKRNSARE